MRYPHNDETVLLIENYLFNKNHFYIEIIKVEKNKNKFLRENDFKRLIGRALKNIERNDVIKVVKSVEKLILMFTFKSFSF